MAAKKTHVRQEILVGLVVVTLITNVVLGVELYNAVHKPITSGLTASTSLVSTKSVTSPTSQSGASASGQFSYEFRYHLHVENEGKYLVTANFAYPDEVVLIYLPDGKVVTLTAEKPEGVVHLDSGEVTLKILVSGVYYGPKPSPTQVLESLNLTIISYYTSDD